MEQIKQHLSTIILVAVFLIGLCLLLYPTVSDSWNTLHQSRAIASYTEQVAAVDDDQYAQLLEEAAAYNDTLSEQTDRWRLSDAETQRYNGLLDVTGTGVMGYIEIDKISCKLPIYHGADDSALQSGVGHLPGSSLPIGGAGTHCVLSGHRGLSSARLFTDLDQMEIGDTFVLCVLDETLTYEVDQILIVEPDDLSALQIEEGQDLCTLVTCTPYGVNSHRLLVRGHRVENAPETVRVTADAVEIEPIMVAPLMALPMLFGLLIALLAVTRKRRK